MPVDTQNVTELEADTHIRIAAHFWQQLHQIDVTAGIEARQGGRWAPWNMAALVMAPQKADAA